MIQEKRKSFALDVVGLKCLLDIQVGILCKSTIQAFMERIGVRHRYLGVFNMYVVLRPCKRMWFPREKCREKVLEAKLHYCQFEGVMSKSLRRIRIGFRIESVEGLSLQRRGNNSQIVMRDRKMVTSIDTDRFVYLDKGVVFSVSLNEITG